jgi:hypothetical protein
MPYVTVSRPPERDPDRRAPASPLAFAILAFVTKGKARGGCMAYEDPTGHSLRRYRTNIREQEVGTRDWQSGRPFSSFAVSLRVLLAS